MLVEIIKTGDLTIDKRLEIERDHIARLLREDNENCNCVNGIPPKITISFKGGAHHYELDSCKECYNALDKFLQRHNLT